MANSKAYRLTSVVFSALGLALLIWGLVLNLSGHETAQSWSLIGVGAATFGSMGVTWRRRR
jgi:hypothetical protein